jgi:hypothetical protein
MVSNRGDGRGQGCSRSLKYEGTLPPGYTASEVDARPVLVLVPEATS